MSGPRAFANRDEGGRVLGTLLREETWAEPVVLGLARGGVPVAAGVATALRAPLGVAVARKIGAPGHPEFGVGAVTANGPPIYDSGSVSALGLTEAQLTEASERERAEARRRVERYQRGLPALPVEGRDVILVDDGLATGVTATAALRALRAEGPRRLVLAAPVCAAQAVDGLRGEADELVCVSRPHDFRAVGQWYADFGQTSDDEVISLLGRD